VKEKVNKVIKKNIMYLIKTKSIILNNWVTKQLKKLKKSKLLKLL